MKKIILLSTIFLLAFAISCNEEDLDKLNPNGVTFDTYFNNAAELTAGVNSIYSIVQGLNLGAREYFFLHDMRSDDVATGGGQLEAHRAQLLNGVHDPANGVTVANWTGWYRTIHRANVIIKKGPEIPATAISESLRNRLIGEARFMRAWAYYEIATLFGGGPIYTSFVESVDGSAPRSSADEMYAVAIEDLKFADANLPATYGNADRGRATKGAAQMLLARVYLQKGDYNSAKAELQKIVNSGTYSLAPDYSLNSVEEGEFGPESIFEIAYSPSNGAFNWGGDGDGAGIQEETVRSQEYAPIAWRNLIPSDKLLNTFEHVDKGDAKSDPRFQYSFYVSGDTYNNGTLTLTDDKVQGNTSNVRGETKKVSWKKYTIMYKSAAANQQSGINLRVMRYADALLLLAECENELGNSAAAIALVNQVRARPGVEMPPLPTANIPTGTQAQLRAAIQRERQVELAGEQVRNADILRWRKHGKLASEPISYFQANKHELLPIPQNELDNNPNMDQGDQNPGY